MKPVINSSDFGYVVINDERHNSVVLYSGGEIKDVPVEHDSINIDFVDQYLKPGIGLVIIGTGTAGVLKVPADLEPHLKEKGIGLIAKITPEAIVEFNNTIKNTVAFIHVTC